LRGMRVSGRVVGHPAGGAGFVKRGEKEGGEEKLKMTPGQDP
jgi:hypothetical protein